MIKMRNYCKSKVVGVGDVRVVTNLGHNLFLKNVRHVLELRLNLMSTGDRMIEVMYQNLLRVYKSSPKVIFLCREERDVTTSTG